MCVSAVQPRADTRSLNDSWLFYFTMALTRPRTRGDLASLPLASAKFQRGPLCTKSTECDRSAAITARLLATTASPVSMQVRRASEAVTTDKPPPLLLLFYPRNHVGCGWGIANGTNRLHPKILVLDARPERLRIQEGTLG